MKVHIGITSKNRASILPKAIRSGLEQRYSPKKISVFDDASTDNTAALQVEFPQVNWIISDQTKGYVYARNLFLEDNEAEFFSSLDDDSWFLQKNALDVAVKAMNDDPTIGAIAFDIRDHDRPDTSPEPLAYEETNMFIGCGHLLRVSAVRQVGCYIPPPGYYGGEEKDLCIRLMDAGFKIVRINGLIVWHDKTNVARNHYFQHRSGVCNDLVFAFRRTPLILLVPSLLTKFYKHFIFSATYKKEKLLRPCLAGFKDFFKFVFTGRVNRRAVSLKTFRKYLSLN
jgi:GT2 family glycosyltransferase